MPASWSAPGAPFLWVTSQVAATISVVCVSPHTDSVHTSKDNITLTRGRQSTQQHSAHTGWLYPTRQQLPNFPLVLHCSKCPFSPLNKLPVPTWAAHPLHALQIPDKSTSGRFVSPPVWDGGPQLTVLLQLHLLFVRDYNLMAQVPHGPQCWHHLK